MTTSFCRLYVDDSLPSQRMLKATQAALSHVDLAVPLEIVKISEAIAIKEGITRVPVFEIWSVPQLRKVKLDFYHVGLMDQAELQQVVVKHLIT